MTRIAIMDAEGTGLPFLANRGLFHPVEVAAVVLDTDAMDVNLAEPFHILIKPPNMRILEHPDTQEGLYLSGTTLVEEVRAYGAPVPVAAGAWETWCARHHVNCVAAYNFGYDRKLCPWISQPWVRCLMHWGRTLVEVNDPEYSGLYRPGKGIKMPSVEEMALWLRTRGFNIPRAFPSHRALPDARREALMMLCYLMLDPNGLRLSPVNFK